MAPQEHQDLTFADVMEWPDYRNQRETILSKVFSCFSNCFCPPKSTAPPISSTLTTKDLTIETEFDRRYIVNPYGVKEQPQSSLLIDDHSTKVQPQSSVCLNDTESDSDFDRERKVDIKKDVIIHQHINKINTQNFISHEINVNLDEATQNLPPTHTWKYRPVFIQPAGDTYCPNHTDPNESLPIGTPFKFETSLFKGQALFRLRNGKSDNPDNTKSYFDTYPKYRYQRQLVIQGNFKHKTNMSEVFIGDVFDTPLKLKPPPRINNIICKLFNRLAPGIYLDLVSSKPKVLALIGAGSHTLSIDDPGTEPNIMDVILPENTPISHDSEKRKKVLGQPTKAKDYEFDPKFVYTFHTCDEALDLADYRFRLPILSIDFTRVLGDGQPMSIRAVHDCSGGDFLNGDSDKGSTSESGSCIKSLFFFRIWHERTLIEVGKDNMD